MLISPPNIKIIITTNSYLNAITLNSIPKTNNTLLTIINIVDEYFCASFQLDCDNLDNRVI